MKEIIHQKCKWTWFIVKSLDLELRQLCFLSLLVPNLSYCRGIMIFLAPPDFSSGRIRIFAWTCHKISSCLSHFPFNRQTYSRVR